MLNTVNFAIREQGVYNIQSSKKSEASYPNNLKQSKTKKNEQGIKNNASINDIYLKESSKTIRPIKSYSDIDKMYDKEYGFLNVDSLCRDILKLHSRNVRYSSHDSVSSKSEKSIRDEFSFKIYEQAEQIAKEYYKEGETIDSFGNILSLREFQNEIHTQISDISKTIEKQIDSMKGDSNVEESNFNNFLDDEFIKILKNHKDNESSIKSDGTVDEKVLLNLKDLLSSNTDFKNRSNKLKSFILQDSK